MAAVRAAAADTPAPPRAARAKAVTAEELPGRLGTPAPVGAWLVPLVVAAAAPTSEAQRQGLQARSRELVALRVWAARRRVRGAPRRVRGERPSPEPAGTRGPRGGGGAPPGGGGVRGRRGGGARGPGGGGGPSPPPPPPPG